MAHKKLFVNNKDESIRIFENDILDRFSRIHWTFPLSVYLPIILYFLYRGVFLYEMPVLYLTGLFLGGVLLWTLFEYLMHRFVFHYEPTSDLGKRVHFLTHGVHHDYPNDSKRLVMPPGASFPLAAVFYLLFFGLMGPMYAAPFFSGFAAGYLIYDLLHYATHHAKWNNRLFLKLKKSHMAHHFREPDAGYSVSVLFWDNIFRTTFKQVGRKKSRQKA